MTADDDAFIRTIVDNPGQDVPRLVYADWLDDRDDPRGSFLRAEVEWAQPWKDGIPPGWSKRVPGRAVPEWSQPDWPGLEPMQLAASGLHPLWVARICRPPLGICADHVKLNGADNPPTIDEIRKTEERLQIRFHSDHLAFLLNYNGGESEPCRALICSGDSVDGFCYNEFYFDWFSFLPAPGTFTSHHASLEQKFAELRYSESLAEEPIASSVTERFLPIASSDLLIYLMEYSPTPLPAIWWVMGEYEPSRPQYLTPSLPQLLARIVVE